MSDLYVNVRFGTYHFQVTSGWKLSVEQNPWHVRNRPERWFEVYEFFGR